jgi:4-hydroxybenzoate polyprenyltransferase
VRSQPPALSRQLAGVARLTRAKEHLLFTVTLTLMGTNLAVARQPAALDVHSFIVLLANILAVTCAFMINDIEDAADDAADPHRAARNAIARGDLSRRAGWRAAAIAAGLALALYALTPPLAFGTGVLTLALALLYSWRPARLKAVPVLDLIAHVLMLSALLFLAGFFAYDSALGAVWWVALGVALVSAYGQLYNQLRDFELDRAAGLHNSAALLGRAWTRRLMYVALVLAAACLAVTVARGLWPLWLAIVLAFLTPLAAWRRSGSDMRGTAAIDASGRYQGGVMLAAALTMLTWLGSLVLAG